MDVALDVALVTAANTLDEPECKALASALRERGLSAATIAWDDSAVDWANVGIAVIRAPWDYHLRLDEFLAWGERAAAVTRLWNPLPVIRWNARKTYLRDLAARGVATIPTLWLPHGSAADLAVLLRERGWERAVVKPVVSASAYQTLLVTPETLTEAQAHLTALLTERDAMLQPYMESVATSGERSLVFIENALSHAVRRAPVLSLTPDTRNHSGPIAVAPDEEAFARAVLHASSVETLYARVDILRDAEGVLRLMELELIEPALWLHTTPGTAERFAEAIARRLA